MRQCRSQTLYVVEVKDGDKELDNAKTEAESYARAIEQHQKTRKMRPPWKTVAVGITIDYQGLLDSHREPLHHGVKHKRAQPRLV